MRNIITITRKELYSYLTSPMAYIVTAVFLGLSGAFFSSYLAATEYADTSIKGFLNAAQILILIFAAILTMRQVAEEKKIGTWEFLLTAPVRDTEIILSKFIGSLVVLTGMLILTVYYPLLLIILGDPDLGPIATSYLGLFLLGSASLAVGIFATSLTPNQIASAVIAGGILFALWFLAVAGRFAPGALGEVISFLSLSSHFPDFVRGIVDTKAIVYYLSITALFLFLAMRSIESGRWR